jgi:protein SMG6
MPGYTILVIDTNILLASLSMFASVVESQRWTVVVPLPVIMELDGLSSNASQLGEAARGALAYITSHIRTYAASLKVQTSKGNYLTTLSVRTEQVDFNDGQTREQNMDDLILKAAIWQDEHWVDRSSMLKGEGVGNVGDTTKAVKVVLLSLDRNCKFYLIAEDCADLCCPLLIVRLKSRSRQLPAASEKDLASILGT